MRTCVLAIFAILVLVSAADVTEAKKCNACKEIVGFIEGWLAQNTSAATIEADLAKVCNLVPALSQTCEELVAVGIPTIISWLENKETPSTVCTKLHLCNATSTFEKQRRTASKLRLQKDLADAAVTAGGQYTLVLAQGDELKDGAACLDGSPPGYYFSAAPAGSKNADKWVVFIQGGGWCYNEQECYDRSKTFLGTSTVWPKNASFEGNMDTSAANNPDFWDWNKAMFNYCDGASFSGNHAGTVKVNNKDLYFRGHTVLNALFQSLKNNYGFDKATSVLLSGCSAGGLSTYLHADYVGANFIPAGADYKAMPISGYFLDFPNVDGKKVYTTEMQYVFNMQAVGNSIFNTNSKCMLFHKPTNDQWKCFMAQYVLPHIQTPYFAFNSLYDSWQMGNIVGIDDASFMECAGGFPKNCTAKEIAEANQFYDTMLTLYKTTPSFHDQTNNGAFLHSCWAHCAACNNGAWNGVQINGKTIRQTVGDWYFGRSNRNEYIDCKYPNVAPYPCNPTCGQ